MAGDPFPFARLIVLVWALLPASGSAQWTGFPEGQARITRILVQLDQSDGQPLSDLVRDLRAGLGPDVTFVVAVDPGQKFVVARRALRNAGVDPSRIETLRPTVRGVTPWARDRLMVVRDHGRVRFLTPPFEAVAGDRRGDAVVARGLALRAGPPTLDLETPFVFEGGNLLVTRDCVIASAAILAENRVFGVGEDALRRDVRRHFGLPLLTVGRAGDFPHDHLDMYATIIGPREVLVGDTRQGADLLSRLRAESAVPTWDDWTAASQTDAAPVFDDVAADFADAGFRVHRIPLLVGNQGNFLTWNNALVECRHGIRRAYVPDYGIPLADELVWRRYRSLGIDVFPVSVTPFAALGGTVRCTTNVLDWVIDAVPPPATIADTPLDLESLPTLGDRILQEAT